MKIAKVKSWTFVLISWMATSWALADQEAGNTAHVVASRYGHFYAKSVPTEHFGTAGQTSVYHVTDTDDELLHTFPWYAKRLYLQGFLGSNTVYVAQMGPWARGRAARGDHLAFAIHKDGELVKSYSTLAISNLGARPVSSVSHYTMFREVLGFRRPWGNQLVFEVLTHDNERLTFDVETGALMTSEEEQLREQLYYAKLAISALKRKWYRQHEGQMPNIHEHEITETELRQIDAAPFLGLPPGYRYIPGVLRQPVRFERQDSELRDRNSER